MSRHVEVDAARCTGCRACMLTCSLRRMGETRLSGSAIQVFSSADEGKHAPIVCLACPSRPCIEACPVRAIVDADDTPLLDVKRCIGCRACIAACPYGAIGYDEALGKAVKCDLCDGDPLCVSVCNAATTMPGALRILDGPPSAESLDAAQERLANAESWRCQESRHAR